MRRLRSIERKLDLLLERTLQMAITQEQFDTDLAAFVAAVSSLIAAIEAALASKPAADLTNEDAQVQTAAAAVADELAKLAPAPPEGS